MVAVHDGALSRHIGVYSTMAVYGKARIQLGMLVADGEVAVRRVGTRSKCCGE